MNSIQKEEEERNKNRLENTMFTIESQQNFFENSLMVPSPPVTMTSTTGRREGINDEITLDFMKNEV